jgi:hypothetical protein
MQDSDDLQFYQPQRHEPFQFTQHKENTMTNPNQYYVHVNLGLTTVTWSFKNKKNKKNFWSSLIYYRWPKFFAVFVFNHLHEARDK